MPSQSVAPHRIIVPRWHVNPRLAECVVAITFAPSDRATFSSARPSPGHERVHVDDVGLRPPEPLVEPLGARAP